MLNEPEIGPHYKIMTFEKNENPQNILVVYTKLDDQCRFLEDDHQPLIDFYWLMDEKKFKPTHPLIKSAVRGRLAVSNASSRQFSLHVSELKELKSNLTHPTLLIKAEKDRQSCRVAAYFPDDLNRTIEVASIYSESRKTLLPPFRKLLAVTIRGTAFGKAVERKFLAR